MIIIDAATVAVTTEAELREVLSGSNAYTTIYFADDIRLTQGVRIPAGKTSLVIDGRYPVDDSGTIHTYTDMNSAMVSDAINVTAGGTLAVTVQNMNITGRNYYGVIAVPDGISGVTLNFVNVNYTGPQFIYNPLGYNTITDCTFNSASSTACATNEMAELSHLTIGGKTIFNHSSTLSFIWFRAGSSPVLEIAENATVTISTTSYCFYTDIFPDITIQSGAEVSFYPTLGMFLNTSHYANSLTMKAASALTVKPGTGATSAYSPPLTLNGNMTVDGAKVFIQSTLSSVSPLYFRTAATLTVTNPQSFVLYSNAAPAITTASGTLTFNISAEQVNLWAKASSADPGGINDVPDFKWYRYNSPDMADNTTLSMMGSAALSVWTVTANNFTSQELSSLPALTNFLPGTGQVLSLGKLLTLNPIVSGQYPISGTTMADAGVRVEYEAGGTAYSDTGTTDATGYFSILPSAAMAAEMSVTITAHLPFLTGMVTKIAVDGGELSLEVPGGDLPFMMVPLDAQNKLLYGRETVWQQIVVHDTRIYPTPWQLSATLNADMTSKVNSAHTLPGALIFIDNDNQTYPLGSEAVVVFTHDGAIAGDTNITWDGAKGILLQGDEVTFFAAEKYTADINWRLEIKEIKEMK